MHRSSTSSSGDRNKHSYTLKRSVCGVTCEVNFAVALTQVRWSSPESHAQVAGYHKQVLPAHRDGITRLLSALETAQPVSLTI